MVGFGFVDRGALLKPFAMFEPDLAASAEYGVSAVKPSRKPAMASRMLQLTDEADMYRCFDRSLGKPKRLVTQSSERLGEILIRKGTWMIEYLVQGPVKFSSVFRLRKNSSPSYLPCEALSPRLRLGDGTL